MNMTRKIALGLSLAATVAAGAAFAEQAVNHGGSATRAEAQARAQARFARIDANHDGKLDMADRAARRAALFDRIDADHDGRISRAEFDAPRGRGGPARDRGPEARGEGRQSGAPGWGRHGGRHGHRGAMMLGRMADANRDGAVSQGEFVSAALQRFDRADADHDGTVTAQERQAARAAMRAHRHGRMGQPPAAPRAD